MKGLMYKEDSNENLYHILTKKKVLLGSLFRKGKRFALGIFIEPNGRFRILCGTHS